MGYVLSPVRDGEERCVCFCPEIMALLLIYSNCVCGFGYSFGLVHLSDYHWQRAIALRISLSFEPSCFLILLLPLGLCPCWHGTSTVSNKK